METRESLNIQHEAGDTFRIAIVGTRFMGRARSNAYGQVGRFVDLPAEPMRQVACGRDPKHVAEFARQFGWRRDTDGLAPPDGAVAGVYAEPNFYDGLRCQQVLDAVLHASRNGIWQAITES